MAKIRADAHRNRERLLAAADLRPSPQRTAPSCRWRPSPATPASGSARSTGTSPAARRSSKPSTAPSWPRWRHRRPTCCSTTRPSWRCGTGWTATRPSSPPSRAWPSRLGAMFASGAVEPSDTRASIARCRRNPAGGGACGRALRSDVSADDVVSSLIGICLASHSTEQAQPNARPARRRSGGDALSAATGK